MQYIEIYVKNALFRSRLQNTDYALNPYRGCEHRCVYCYAPYVLHMPIEEWNTRVYVKRNLPTVLDRELRKKKGSVEIGTVTDAYQPAERKFQITRMSLEVLKRHRVSVSILTKSSLVLRDLDILRNMNAEVGLTITTLDDALRKRIEPYASSVNARLKTLEELSEELRTYAFVGPIFPKYLLPELEELMKELKRIKVSYVIFDRFRWKKGMHVPDFLEPNFERWNHVKREIERIARKFDLRYYFGW